MKTYLAVLIFFLIAFAGLATGLILKRKGLRGGCSPPSGSGHDCQCKSATKSGVMQQGNQPNKCDP